MDSKKHIGILHLQIELNKTCGVTRAILRIIKNSTNYDHHVIALGGNAVDRFKGCRYKLITADRNSILGTVKIFFEIRDYIKNNKIRIVHAHHRYFDLLAFLLKRFTSVRTVTTVHSEVYKKKLLSYKSDEIIAVSNAIKFHLIKNFNLNTSNITFISNFVDVKEIEITKGKEEVFSELGLKKGTEIIGYFGRLDINEKGVDILLDAFEKVSQDNNSVVLILAGDGVDAKELKEIAVRRRLSALFLGNVDNIWNYMNVCDMVVLPSRVEPFNLVMIEAGLLNKPLIGSDVGGIAETIEDNVTGFLFKKENVNELSDRITTLLADKNLMFKLGSNLNNLVLRKFTSEIIIPKIESLYGRLLAKE
jgi:glycosyltransferase involved in cell wall biosynthesis